MALACFQIASKIFRRDKFKHGEAKLLNQNKPMKKPASSKPPKRSINRNPLFH